MERIEINECLFKKMIDGVKHCIASDYARPILTYIQIKVAKGFITMYALDGFRLGKTQATLEQATETEFTCFIKPLAIKPSKQGTNPVVIKCDGNYSFVEVITEYGKVEHCFKQPTEKFIDAEKILQDNKVHDREIAFNAALVAQALKALSGADKNNTVIFESKNSSIEPFILRAKDDLITNEQLILPIRINIS